MLSSNTFHSVGIPLLYIVLRPKYTGVSFEREIQVVLAPSDAFVVSQSCGVLKRKLFTINRTELN